MRLFILLAILNISTFNSFSQLRWNNFLDTKKNGFVEHENPYYNFVTPKISEKQYEILKKQKKIIENGGGVDIKNTIREPIVYRKPNGNLILIWNDTREKITKNEYAEIQQLGNNTYLVIKDGIWGYENRGNRYKKGIIDTLGNFLQPIIWDEIKSADPIVYKENGGELSKDNLETQMFVCKKDDANFVILRNGDILLEEESKQISVNYFVKNGKIYNIFNVDLMNWNSEDNRFYISTLFKKPDLCFNGSYHSTESHSNQKFFPNELIAICGDKTNIEWGSKKFFDFSISEYIESIPSFHDFLRVSKKYAIIKSNGESLPMHLLSNDLNDIITLPSNYIRVELFNFYYDGIQNDDKVKLAGAKFGFDSLFHVEVKIEEPERRNAETLYKIGYGEVLSKLYANISIGNKDFAIVKQINDQSENLISLKTFEEVFPKNFDKIIFEKDEKGRYFFKCIFDGKIQRIYPEKIK